MRFCRPSTLWRRGERDGGGGGESEGWKEERRRVSEIGMEVGGKRKMKGGGGEKCRRKFEWVRRGKE